MLLLKDDLPQRQAKIKRLLQMRATARQLALTPGLQHGLPHLHDVLVDFCARCSTTLAAVEAVERRVQHRLLLLRRFLDLLRFY